MDPECLLAEDMKKLLETEGVDHILFHVAFDDKFPYSPPFVRVVKPVISGGYVLAGGAICMELLTPQGWSSAYTIEAVILQITATFAKGKARVVFSQAKVGIETVSSCCIYLSDIAVVLCREKHTHWPRHNTHLSHLSKFMKRVVSHQLMGNVCSG